MPASPGSSTFTFMPIVYMNGLLFTVEPRYLEPSMETIVSVKFQGNH